MDFTLSEDQQSLVDVLARFSRERYGIAKRTAAAGAESGHDVATWAQLAELGVIGMLFSPEVGGYGGNAFDIMAVFETLGHGLVGEPVLPALLAGTVLAAAGSDALDRLIDGSAIAVPAFYEPTSRYDLDRVATTATEQSQDWKIDGAKAVVHHAEAAQTLIVTAREANGTVSVFAVPAAASGVTMRGYVTNDGIRAAEVKLEGVIVPKEAKLGGVALARDAVDAGTLAICAEALGLMTWLKDATLEYLRTRIQFGKPIGNNQVLQHRMADIVVEMEQARSAVINAAAAMDGPADARALALSAAKYTIGTTATMVAEEAIQMHGGIGMTEELGLSHFAKRALMIDHQFGDSDHHLRRYITLSAA